MRGQPDVIGWRRVEAEAMLRAAGVKVIQLTATTPPKPGGAAGGWRVVRQRRLSEDEVSLVVAQEVG